MYDKFCRLTYKIILIFLLLLSIYVTFSSICKIYSSKEDLAPVVILIGVITAILLCISVKNIASKLSKKQNQIIAICLCLIACLGMAMFGHIFKSIPSYDLSNIIREKEIMLDNGGKFETESYFAKYVNQTPIAILVYVISKFGMIFGMKDFIITANAMLIALTAYFLYLTVRRTKDEKIALTTLIFFVLNPIIYIYTSYYYTDTLCMPFAMISIYLYVCAMQTEKIKFKILFSSLSGFILAFGFELRVVLAIIMIGIIVAEILTKKTIKEKIATSVALIIGFLIGVILYNVISMQFGVLENKELEFPATHYLMMGLNKDSAGRWNNEDYNYTYNSGDYKEKLNANLSKIYSRLKSFGLSGIVELGIKKLEVNWSNGDYDYIPKFQDVEQMNKLYEFFVGNKKIFVLYYLQICKTVLLAMFTIAVVTELKKESNQKFIFITMFGFFIFYLFWEVLSRYSLTCMPWLMLALGIGIEKVEQFLEIEKVKLIIRDNKEEKINFSKITKFSLISIIIITIGFLAIGFDKYCMKKKTYYDSVALQIRTYNTIEDISDKVIQQEFIADKKFNHISLKFTKKAKEERGNYCFELLNQQEETLFKKEFSTETIKNNSYKSFDFDYVKPNGKEKYIIKIYNTDMQNAEKSDVIGIYIFKAWEEYNIYPDGNVQINGENQNLDIVFRVENKRERIYISKILYIVLSCVIIIIEIFGFYPYIKKDVNRRVARNEEGRVQV